MSLLDPTSLLFGLGKHEKSKKNYTLFLFDESTCNASDVKVIDKVISASLPDTTVIRSNSPSEALKVLQLKSTELVVVDSGFFANTEDAMLFAYEAKRRRKMPFLFVSNDVKNLIEHYRAHMKLYQERDDYILSPVDFSELSKKLKRAVGQEGRSAARFSIQEKIQIFRLRDESQTPCQLTDLSLVGCGVDLGPSMVFDSQEQVRISLRLSDFDIFHPQFGEFLNLSAKVRRVSIHGQRIGCSFEHLTDQQFDCTASILEHVIQRARNAKKNRRQQSLNQQRPA